jgi:hypothetical protein
MYRCVASSYRSNDLPTVLTCSSYDFMVQCIGIVTRVVGSEPIQRTYPAPAAQAIAYGTAQAHQATDNSRASYAMVE